MGRMTSHCIKFKAVYCQETCKAARVCTELILEIPWSQTKDSTGKAEGGLKHSHANCCQLPELGQDAELCVAASRARAEQRIVREPPFISSLLSCCNSRKVLNAFHLLAFCSLRKKDQLVIGWEMSTLIAKVLLDFSTPSSTCSSVSTDCCVKPYHDLNAIGPGLGKQCLHGSMQTR